MYPISIEVHCFIVFVNVNEPFQQSCNSQKILMSFFMLFFTLNTYVMGENKVSRLVKLEKKSPEMPILALDTLYGSELDNFWTKCKSCNHFLWSSVFVSFFVC